MNRLFVFFESKPGGVAPTHESARVRLFAEKVLVRVAGRERATDREDRQTVRQKIMEL